LLDIGIYCINAARAVFGAEPVEATALVERDREERFREVEEAVGAVLRFPGGRLASFVCSFGASSVAEYRILGERGDLRVEPAFHYQGALRHHLTAGGRTLTRTFPARDQFAPLLERFSEAIRGGGEVQPDGLEGLADVRVIEAIHRSAASGRPAVLEPMEGIKRPDPAQGVRKPPVREALTVDVEPASQ
ncbi:MAG TPA: Gfo/Idh/MocA family oxidoreductase, partial [Planctomycetota bacterium]|nr:Gfo/Idh/MocA family oxidoreductase [Planctomycetota bacterium]